MPGVGFKGGGVLMMPLVRENMVLWCWYPSPKMATVYRGTKGSWAPFSLDLTFHLIFIFIFNLTT